MKARHCSGIGKYSAVPTQYSAKHSSMDDNPPCKSHNMCKEGGGPRGGGGGLRDDFFLASGGFREEVVIHKYIHKGMKQ